MRVQGSGFRVQGSGFMVQGSWFRVRVKVGVQDTSEVRQAILTPTIACETDDCSGKEGIKWGLGGRVEKAKAGNRDG